MVKRATVCIIIIFYSIICFSQDSLWSYYTRPLQTINSISEQGNFLYVAKNTAVVKINKMTGTTDLITYNDLGLESGYKTLNSTYSVPHIVNLEVDKKGVKWMELFDGNYYYFASYNGSKLTVYNSANSPLTPITILQGNMEMLIDSSNNKWFGTPNNLVKYNDTTWSMYDTSNSVLPNNYISSLRLDDSNNVWIETAGKGIVKYNGVDFIVYNIPSFAAGANVFFDNKNDLFYYFGGDSVIYKYDGTSITTLPLPESFKPRKIVFDRFNDIWVDNQNIFNSDSTYKYNGKNWSNVWDSVLIEPIQNIFADDSGNIWVSTQSLMHGPEQFFDGNLAKYNGTNWELYNVQTPSLPSVYVNSIAVDSSNNKWIGTDEGLAVTDEINWTVYDTSNSPMPFNAVSSIAIDSKGVKWIGLTNWHGDYPTYNAKGALAEFNDTSWTIYDSGNSTLPNLPILSIATDKKGNVWLGTEGKGLIRFNGTNWKIFNTQNSELPSDTVKAVAVDKEDILWVGTYKGLAKFDGINWTSYDTVSGLSSLNIAAIAVDDSNNKWIAPTIGYISKYNNTSWITYPEYFYDLTGIAADNKGVLWATTTAPWPTSGLWEFDGQSWIKINVGTFDALAIDKNNKKWLSFFVSGNDDGIAIYSGTDTLVTVGIEKTREKSSHFSLLQNYPNPFNPTTKIEYSVPSVVDANFASTTRVKLKVYDILGRLVATLVNKEQRPGNYEVQFNASKLASGIYFYKLIYGSYTQTKKMVLLK